MILIALGSNLSGRAGTPLETADAALKALEPAGLRLVRASGAYRTAAVGPGAQDDYVNLAAMIDTHLPPAALLSRLHAIEDAFGRARGRRWAARTLDLDLLSWNGVVSGWDGQQPPAARMPRRPVLPHPALHERPFVLAPLMELAPDWHHPVFGLTVRQLWRKLADKGEGAVLERL